MARWRRSHVSPSTWTTTIDDQLWTVQYSASDETYTIFRGLPNPAFCVRHDMTSLTDAQTWVETIGSAKGHARVPYPKARFPRGYDEAKVADTYGDDCACGYDRHQIETDPEGHAERHWMLNLPAPIGENG